VAGGATPTARRTEHGKGENTDVRLFSRAEAERQIHDEVHELLPKIEVIAREVKATKRQARRMQAEALLLARIRTLAGELINQNLHHYAVTLAVGYLRKKHKGIRIYRKDVHARQTGGADDPDIRGHIDGQPDVCAEVTAHLKPQGYVDTRIRDTLLKLKRIQNCQRYYFITTSVMRQRADTKLRKMKCRIKVVLLDTGFDAIVGQDAKKEDA